MARALQGTRRIITALSKTAFTAAPRRHPLRIAPAVPLIEHRVRPNTLAMSSSTTAPSSSSSSGNRLAKSKSPYLLAHAHNPVDWYEWSDDEAWTRAKAENKLVLLSVGYAACHWCHVMAHETFEDDVVAAALRKNYIAIKLDREERPDVDAAYMTFVQSISGRGGWPLNAFLTPDGEPLYGLTYLPKQAFITLCDRLAGLWQDDPQRCRESAADVKAKLAEAVHTPALSSLPKPGVVCRAAERSMCTFDNTYGGFGDAPKFPQVSNTFHVLHRYISGALDGSLLESGATKSSASLALDYSAFSLHKIADGGITDQLGGGFARYSVDDEWRVPHFEKMLYDQAQLLSTFSEAIQLVRHNAVSARAKAALPAMERAIEGAIDYLARDMTAPDGTFYSSEDADSPLKAGDKHGVEGAFYVWSHEEVLDALGGPETTEAKVVLALYDITPEGNIPAASDPHGELQGKNMLHRAQTLEEVATQVGLSAQDAQAALEAAHAKLLEVRSARPRPPLDDKIVTAWNGMAISGLVKAGQALRATRPQAADKAVQMAGRAVEATLKQLYDESTGTLRRSWRDGPGPEGTSLDYAALIQALLDWFETVQEERFLQLALQLQDRQDELFWDDENGGYFISTSHSDGNRLLRMKETQDGAEPTALSLSAHNLARLLTLLDADAARATKRRERLERAIRSGGAVLERAPFAMGMLATAVQRVQCNADKLAIILHSSTSQAQAQGKDMVAEVQSRFLPFLSTVLVDVSDLGRARSSWLYHQNTGVRAALDDPRLEERLKETASAGGEDGMVVAHVCERGACGPPVRDAAAFGRELDALMGCL